MRPIFVGAAVGAILAIPGLVRAGDPWLLFETRPRAPFVLASDGRFEALVGVEVRNTAERAVRVEALRVDELARGAVVATREDATDLFRSAGLVSDPSVDPGSSAAWTGLCLALDSEAVDGVRFTFDLVQWRGWRRVRTRQTLEFAVRRPDVFPLLALPVQGPWRITQGHGCATRHRQGGLGGEFSWDFAAVHEAGRAGDPKRKITGRNADSPTFGRPVVAPVSGVVVSVVDGEDDNDEREDFPRRSLVDSLRRPLWIFGNHVVLEHEGVFVLLAHLQKGSLTVRRGDAVAEGQPIARAGNSGNSMRPHLHLQVMDRADPAAPGVSGLPARLKDYMEVTVRGEGDGRETSMRRVAAGDPPEGALVIAGADPP